MNNIALIKKVVIVAVSTVLTYSVFFLLDKVFSSLVPEVSHYAFVPLILITIAIMHNSVLVFKDPEIV